MNALGSGSGGGGGMVRFLLLGDEDEASTASDERAFFYSAGATSSASTISSATNTLHRLLNEHSSRGRTILTVLYLSVLSLCFLVPVFYYFRMHCEERHARRLRELELAGIHQAMEQSQNLHREESRAARRKFREERKARIQQLFTPVKMVSCGYRGTCRYLF